MKPSELLKKESMCYPEYEDYPKMIKEIGEELDKLFISREEHKKEIEELKKKFWEVRELEAKRG